MTQLVCNDSLWTATNFALVASHSDAGQRVHPDEEAQCPAVPGVSADGERWAKLRDLRERVTEAIEPLRRDKTIRSSLEADVTVPADAVPEGFTDDEIRAVMGGNALRVLDPSGGGTWVDAFEAGSGDAWHGCSGVGSAR